MSGKTPPLPRRETILVIDDEIRAQRLLHLTLEEFGYRMFALSCGEQAIETIEESAPDLVLLDLGLPDVHGVELCQRIRAESLVPIIVVSGSKQPADIVQAFEAGADDYVRKPFDPLELAVRIKAVLRRVNGSISKNKREFRNGPLTIDFDQRLVTISGREVPLSRTEYRLLEYLALNAGRTLVSEALLTKVWGPEYSNDYPSLHLYISRLRRKLCENAHDTHLIITKPGIGYTMPIDEPNSCGSCNLSSQ